MINVCICGGGSLGHVIAGYLASKDNASVYMFTQRAHLWSNNLTIYTPNGSPIISQLDCVTTDAQSAVSNADIVLLCLPGYAIKEELTIIAPYLKAGTFVGSVFSSTGFFFEAMQLLDEEIPLWGFQRVPFIARTKEYGRNAFLLGYKLSHNIAVERCKDKETFRTIIEDLFDAPVNLLNNFYEATFTNSNPILHPARLYSLFSDWNESLFYDREFLFYEEWNNVASELLIQMDNELFGMLKMLPVSPHFLLPILEYYESHDADSLTRKIRSIVGFKGIKTPMVETEMGWQPDLNSRYFQEDFAYGLRYIHETAHRFDVDIPVIDRIYEWGVRLAKRVDNKA